ncbi:MAG TPA: glycosyltransferase family 4 protein [Polyangiaceae bacterium]|nr:glycosyltransferase family 4 protein [Polyangiaceae bacterium]
MRVAYLSGSEIPSRAANTVHVMKMCAAFAGQGHQVDLWARTTRHLASSAFRDFGVPPVFRIHAARWPPLPFGIGSGTFALQVMAGAHCSRPDLIYGRHLPSIFGLASMGSLAALEMHTPPENALKATLIQRLLRMPAFLGIVVISDALKQHFLGLFPTAERHIFVAHDGADPPCEERTEFGRKAQNNGRPQVGYVGHLYPGRGIELILELAQRMPAVDFHLVGGTDADLRRWSQSAGEQANIRFHGYVRHADLARHYASFDVLLAPYQSRVAISGGAGDTSRWMSPLKLFEYMAQRKPLVVSDLPVLREIVQHERTALVCRADDVRDWQSAIERLSQDEELSRRLSAAAYYDFNRFYTWTTRAQAILNFLDAQRCAKRIQIT